MLFFVSFIKNPTFGVFLLAFIFDRPLLDLEEQAGVLVDRLDGGKLHVPLLLQLLQRLLFVNSQRDRAAQGLGDDAWGAGPVFEGAASEVGVVVRLNDTQGDGLVDRDVGGEVAL